MKRAKYCQIVKGQGNQLDQEMEIKHLAHPAHVVEITDSQEDSKHNIRVYTDGSKSEHGEGSRIATFRQQINRHKKLQIKRALSNNQTEKLAIIKALENLQFLEINDRITLIPRQQNNTRIAQKPEEPHISHRKN